MDMNETIAQAEEQMEGLGLLVSSYYNSMLRSGMPPTLAQWCLIEWYKRLLDSLYPAQPARRNSKTHATLP